MWQWLTKRSLADEESYVRDPRRVRRMIVRQCLLGAVGIGALAVVTFADPGPLRAASGAAVGWFVGSSVLIGLRRALSYRNGWLDGRTAMVHTMMEAQQRGLTPAEWLESEMARDLAVMGVPPPDPTGGRDAGGA